MTMAKEERLQIVQFLRDTQAIFETRRQKGDEPIVCKHHAESCKYAAAAIERGEHWLAMGSEHAGH